MKRRSFLGLATVGAASTTARLSFGTSGEDDPQRLAAALERATAVGKPLLVIVVPEEEAAAASGGRLLGDFLAHAPDEDLALLALCELTCVPRRELEKKVGSIPKGTFAVLLETGAPRPDLGRIAFDELVLQPSLDQRTRVNKALGRRLRELLYTSEEAFQARAKWNYAKQGAAGLAGISFFSPEARPRTVEVDHAALVLYQRALAVPTEKEMWIERLAYAAAARLWDRDPDGARWSIDPSPSMRPDPCPPCGMAVCPPASRTFLDYYTK